MKSNQLKKIKLKKNTFQIIKILIKLKKILIKFKK